MYHVHQGSARKQRVGGLVVAYVALDWERSFVGNGVNSVGHGNGI